MADVETQFRVVSVHGRARVAVRHVNVGVDELRELLDDGPERVPHGVVWLVTREPVHVEGTAGGREIRGHAEGRPAEGGGVRVESDDGPIVP
ncbi:hypothetical protein GP486_006911, partial [Trichoglossum hirsutum]